MSEKNKIAILNLRSQTSQSLLEVFDALECEIFSRESARDYESLDFIFVDTEEEAKQAEKDFETGKNDISVVCLGPVKEMKGFLLRNGRLSMDPEFLDSKLGRAILNKFLTRECNIHLDESFSGLFPSVESFKITNHLALGSSLDELSLKAFENDFNIVALRSFFDHSLIYFTYLKQAGLAGAPYEIEHSFNQDFFAVNIHAPIKNFVAEYLMDSFGSVNSKDPLQYLLAVASRSADFMDVTYVEKPGRVVLTGFWNKSEKRKLGGIAFNNVKTTSQVASLLERKLKRFTPTEEARTKFEESAQNFQSRSLPGSLLEIALSHNEDSALNSDPENSSRLFAFVIGRFEEVWPGEDINELNMGDLERLLGDYPDQDFVALLNDEDRRDILDKIQKKNITDAYGEELQRVRDSLEDDEEFKQEISGSLNEEVAQRVGGSFDAKDLNTILGGADEEDNHSERVGGKEDVDDFKAVIKGTKDQRKDDFAQRVGGSFENNLGEFTNKISGSGDDPKKGVFNFVSTAMDGIDDLGGDKNARKFFKQNAPKKIFAGLEKYAQGLGLEVQDLSEAQLLEFKNLELPKAIEESLSDEVDMENFVKGLESPSLDRSNQLLNNASPEFREKFKQKLESKLDGMEGLDKVDEKYVFTDEHVGQEDVQKAVQSAMKETLDEECKMVKANKEDLEETEKLIVKKLSESFGKDPEEMTKLAADASEKAKEKEKQKVVENLFKEKSQESQEESSSSNIEQSQLLAKLKKFETENRRLQDTLKGAQVKLESLQEGQEVVKRVEKQAKEETDAELEQDPSKVSEQISAIEKQIEDINQESLEELKEGKSIGREEAEKIAQAVERERLLLQNAKEAETNLRRKEIEHQKKESMLMSELQKSNKSLKAKDMVVEKVKESMQSLAQKKQEEANNYKNQVEELNQRLKDDRATKLEAELKSVKKEYENVGKIAEMYKNKVDHLIKADAQKAKSDNSEQMASENRSLARMKIQLENKLAAEIREKKSFESQYEKLKAQEGKLRARANGAETRLKEAQTEMEKLKANEARLVAMAERKQNAVDPKLQKEVETLKSQNAQLQNSLKETIEKLKTESASNSAPAAGSGGQNVKEKHLEQSVKKLNTELSKARNEVQEQKKMAQKLKNEAVGLKNKIAQLEKAGAAKKKAA